MILKDGEVCEDRVEGPEIEDAGEPLDVLADRALTGTWVPADGLSWDD